MKITLISYDYFGYDKHIVTELQKRNIKTTHIDLNKHHFEYFNKFEKFLNFFSKLFFKRNSKEIAIKNYILKALNENGIQDKILVIRPDLISKKTHLKIKKKTNEYICYLYDSCNRFKVKHLFKGIFDRIYSYDLNDSNTYNLIPITNYMYFDKKKDTYKKTKYDAFIVISPDERLSILNKIAVEFEKINLNFKFIIVCPNRPKNLHPKIEHITTKISTNEVLILMKKSSVVIDLIRDNHFGLSFRIFEALALEKKIITTNKFIEKYDFNNPNNILVVEENFLKFSKDFFITPYEPIVYDIFKKYTISNWVDKVFIL